MLRQQKRDMQFLLQPVKYSLSIPLILAVVMLVVGMMIVYARIEVRHRL